MHQKKKRKKEGIRRLSVIPVLFVSEKNNIIMFVLNKLKVLIKLSRSKIALITVERKDKY